MNYPHSKLMGINWNVRRKLRGIEPASALWRINNFFMEPYSTVSRPLISEPWMIYAITARLMITLIIGGLIIYGIYYLAKKPSMESHPESQNTALRSLYLYASAFIGLITIIIAGSSLVSLTLKATIFTKADSLSIPSMDEDCSPERIKNTPGLTAATCEKRAVESKKSREYNVAANRSGELASNLSFLIVGIPLFAYHFKVAQHERKSKA